MHLLPVPTGMNLTNFPYLYSVETDDATDVSIAVFVLKSEPKCKSSRSSKSCSKSVFTAFVTVTAHFAVSVPVVAVMMAVPAATPVTTPSSTVATLVSLLDHVSADALAIVGISSTVRLLLAPAPTDSVPPLVNARSVAATV